MRLSRPRLADINVKVLIWVACALCNFGFLTAQQALATTMTGLPESARAVFVVLIGFAFLSIVSLVFLGLALSPIANEKVGRWRIGGLFETITLIFANLSASAWVTSIVTSAMLGRRLKARGIVVEILAYLPSIFIIYADLSQSVSVFNVVALVIGYQAIYIPAVLVGADLQNRTTLITRLGEDVEAERADKAARVLAARNDERARISREMHDSLAHRLSLISLHAGALAARQDLSADEMREVGTTLQTLASSANQDLREILALLHEDGAGDSSRQRWADVAEAIEAERRAGQSIESRIDPQVSEAFESWPSSIRNALVRIVEQALTNAREHAPGEPVALSVGPVDGGVEVRCSNPIPAPSSLAGNERGRGHGLPGMEERLRLLGGSFAAGVDPSGTRFDLHAAFPLAKEPAHV